MTLSPPSHMASHGGALTEALPAYLVNTAVPGARRLPAAH